LGYGVALAIIATVIPSFFMSNGIKKIGSSNAAIISSIGPVSTILQAHFILGEKITAAQILGTFLVIIGVLLIGWRTGETESAVHKIAN
jgi:drug/metabolite transporter (DMT)-like permease